MQIYEILVGYVNDFKYLKPEIQDMLSGQPEPKRIYRILKTEQKHSETDTTRLYQIYIGASSNKATIDTLFLGGHLFGTYKDQWQFDIELITKENLINFEINVEDLEKLNTWLNSDHADIKDIMEKNPVKVDMTVDQVKRGEVPTTRNIETNQKAVSNVLNFENDFEQFVTILSDSINKIVHKDPKGLMVFSDLLAYVASTHDDKYESGSKSNIAKEFLLSSESSDTAIFNTMKYLQRYSTKGFKKSNQIIDLYKAMHYVMFELQRRKFNND